VGDEGKVTPRGCGVRGCGFGLFAVSFILTVAGIEPLYAEGVKPVGQLEAVVGKVYLIQHKTSIWAKPRMPVYEADTLVTMGRSTALIRFGKFNTIEAYENSSVRIARYLTLATKGDGESKAGFSAIFQMMKGRIRYFLKSTKAQVLTPNTVAGVRGTTFLVEADEENSSVMVAEGVVEVSNRLSPEQKTVLQSGQFTSVLRGELPAAAQAAPIKLIDMIKSEAPAARLQGGQGKEPDAFELLDSGDGGVQFTPSGTTTTTLPTLAPENGVKGVPVEDLSVSQILNKVTASDVSSLLKPGSLIENVRQELILSSTASRSVRVSLSKGSW
jgi:hypothetical protein